jgi:hypothetical protein
MSEKIKKIIIEIILEIIDSLEITAYRSAVGGGCGGNPQSYSFYVTKKSKDEY